MTVKFAKDPRNSITWLALNDATKEKLVGIWSEYNNKGQAFVTQYSIIENLKFEIHRALGMESGHARTLNQDLKRILWEYQGGIYDDIRKYLDKYNAIEAAVKAEVEIRRKTLRPPQFVR